MMIIKLSIVIKTMMRALSTIIEYFVFMISVPLYIFITDVMKSIKKKAVSPACF